VSTGVPFSGVRWPSLQPTASAAFVQVLLHGGLPRAEIARKLGLSRASLTRITKDLVLADLLTEGPTEQRSATGRPSEILFVNKAAHHFLGIKLTGDTLYSVVTDLQANIVGLKNVPLVNHSVADVIGQIADVTREHAARFPRLTSIGVALAGYVEHDGSRSILHDSAYLGWDSVPLGEMVEKATGYACAVENDVQALTAVERWSRIDQGVEPMALITIGVGLGFGFVVNQELVRGAHGRSGKLSHVPVDQSGPLCDRGHHGCASSYLPNGAIANAAGTPGGYQDALLLARSGEPVALAAFMSAGYALGVLIGHVSNMLDPAKIVLTGDGLPLYELAESRVNDGIAATLESDAGPVNLDVQPFDFSEWARAAAALAIFATVS
jgi:predicted NBD/HSP70 family sugar kinase